MVRLTLPFSPTFAAPAGALLGYVGLAKWLYRDPATDQVAAFFDRQPNSYARDSGGMKGTRWAVVAVVKQPNGDFMVTLDAAT